MAQRRFVDFGSPVEASKVKSIIQHLSAPQVLSGGYFIVVGTSELQIQPVALVLPDGILMEETENKSVTQYDGANPLIQTNPKNYTVFYTHNDENVIGGTPANLQVTANAAGGGVFLQGVANGTILGWIKYPGGSVPLNASMFYYPARVRLQSQITSGSGSKYLAPFPNPGSGVLWTANTNTVAHAYDSNGVYTSLTGTGSSQLAFAFKTDFNVPTAIRIDCELTGSGSSATLQVRDSTGSLINFDDGSNTRSIGPGPLAFQSIEARFASGGSFPQGKNFVAHLNVVCSNGSSSLKLYSYGVTSYNTPF